MKENILLLSKYFYYRPIYFRKVLEEIGAENIREAPKDAFFKLGISEKSVEDFFNERTAEKNTVEILKKEDIKLLTIFDAEYPAALKNIYDAPPVLFYRGALSVLKNNLLAIVGSRRAGNYGRRATEFFARGLASHFAIASGLAYGIDSLAHESALSAGGKAIAVLGSGLDEASIYPKINIGLAKRIVESGGLLLSEVPPGIGPKQFHFPMRNRIIAGLSRGILIIEGGAKSGTLITAKLGLEYGADIFAVPGNIFEENSAGVNYLIKCGAHAVTSSDDILEFYGIENKIIKKEYEPKDETERAIFDNLEDGGNGADEIARSSGVPILILMPALTDLEMRKIIKNIGGKYIKF